MKRILAFMIVAALTPPAYGAEETDIWVHEAFSPDVNPQVYVDLADGAKEGCWTNLKEVREYAEGKLQEAGFEVSEPKDATAKFSVMVNSRRNNGVCSGVAEVEVNLVASPVNSGPSGMLIFGNALERGGIFWGQDNANILVLDYIREAVEAIEAQKE